MFRYLSPFVYVLIQVISGQLKDRGGGRRKEDPTKHSAGRKEKQLRVRVQSFRGKIHPTQEAELAYTQTHAHNEATNGRQLSF